MNAFPDSDMAYKDISSMVLFERVMEMVREQGFAVENIDATVIAQKPKLAPYIPQMRQNIAKIAGIEEKRVNIKATTEEGLGFTGTEQGMAAHAVALLIEMH